MSKIKVVRCADSGIDCSFVARSNSEEELLSQVAEHAKTVHGMELNDELVQKVKSLIHEEEYTS